MIFHLSLKLQFCCTDILLKFQTQKISLWTNFWWANYWIYPSKTIDTNHITLQTFFSFNIKIHIKIPLAYKELYKKMLLTLQSYAWANVLQARREKEEKSSLFYVHNHIHSHCKAENELININELWDFVCRQITSKELSFHCLNFR